MPRKGKGQQASRTVTGQQYGEAQAQEESQSVVPLPKMEEPQVSSMRPGETAFNRVSERPTESVMQPMGQRNRVQDVAYTQRQRRKIATMVPLIEKIASDFDSPLRLRNVVREFKKAAGPLDDITGE